MLKKLNGSRTPFGAYHILKGKKSAQTLQDCHLYGLTNFFGVSKGLDRSVFIEQLNLLENHHFIDKNSENHFFVTKDGEAFLERKISALPIPEQLDGFKHKDISDLFWKRLALTIQCLSYILINKSDFIPIIKDRNIQLWVKKWLRYDDYPSSIKAKQLFFELEKILQEFSPTQASLFVLKMSGSHRVGLTIEQAADQLNIDRFYSILLFESVIHGLIDKVNDNGELYPKLYELLNDLGVKSPLSESANKTLALLNAGYTIEKIAVTRRLKKNTVEDHIVEIALNIDGFSIDHFVSSEVQQKIYSVMKEIKTSRLKELKMALDKNVSYFAIRLTIAKKGIYHGS